jgi:hypothetical protein
MRSEVQLRAQNSAGFVAKKVFAVYLRFRAINLPKSADIEQLIAAPG